MTEKKAVLNVTVAESMAEAVRHEAALRNVTISSVVEAALAEQLKWFKIRADGLAAMDEEYRERGYPTPEEEAAAKAWVDEEDRIHAEMLAPEWPSIERSGTEWPGTQRPGTQRPGSETADATSREAGAA